MLSGALGEFLCGLRLVLGPELKAGLCGSRGHQLDTR